MPKLDLSGSVDDRFWVEAVMLFPNDASARQRYFSVRKVRSLVVNAADDGRIDLDAHTVKQLIMAPSYDDLKVRAAEHTKRAIVAGDLLNALYVMDQFGVPEPSMNKAIFAAQKYAKKARYGDKTKFVTSEPKIREYWREFRPAAHFWAALRINQDYPYTDDRRSAEGHKAFLEVAQALFRFGSSFIPFRARPRTPVLERDKCWVLPDTISAKHPDSSKPPERLLKTLKKYKT